MYRDFAEDAIRAVLDEVGLSELIAERGMDFPVGINGAFLSGGQKQKVALARALLCGLARTISSNQGKFFSLRYVQINTIQHLFFLFFCIVAEKNMTKFNISGYGCTIPVPESGRWNIGCPFKPAYFFDWRNFYCAWRPIPPTMVNILEIIDSVFVLRILHI